MFQSLGQPFKGNQLLIPLRALANLFTDNRGLIPLTNVGCSIGDGDGDVEAASDTPPFPPQATRCQYMPSGKGDTGRDHTWSTL